MTPDKELLCQKADKIYTVHLKKSGWYDKIWQAGAILLPVKSVGVKNDQRTYEFTIALRAVNSVDVITADWVRIPYDLMEEISDDIII